MSNLPVRVQTAQALVIAQRWEVGEFIGFETRNKYEIRSPEGELIGYAAEQQKGIGGFLMRQFMGHWRSFDIQLFDAMRTPVASAHHPFRWFFSRLELRDSSGRYVGAIQRRWSWFSKHFIVEDAQRRNVMTVDSPLWRPWTFSFEHNGRPTAVLRKKWSGLFAEGFTDKDRFMIEFSDPALSLDTRMLLVASAIFIDLLYFEHKK